MAELLKSLCSHAALPPKLPGKQESNLEEVEQALTSRLLDACRTLRNATDDEVFHKLERTRKILQICKDLHSGGRLSKTTLVTGFGTLERKDLLILHIAEQNAGLLVRRDHDSQGDIVVFEAFESSPISEKALAANDALLWDFPGSAVAVAYSEFAKTSLQNSLAAFLEQASSESIKRFGAHTNKAGSFAPESRDAVNPSLITRMLMTLLEANGYRTFPPPLRKRVRDDVCWTDGAENPWRRSAYWLVLRVGLSRHLSIVHGSELGMVYYKFLVCLVLKGLLEDAGHQESPDLLTHLQAKLARRLDKLQVNRDRVSPNVRFIYDSIFAKLGSVFQKTIRDVNVRVEAEWNEFKREIRRPVSLLPRRADQGHLALTLPNSRIYLEKVLLLHQCQTNGVPAQASYGLPTKFDPSVATANRFRAFANRYFSLFQRETELESIQLDQPTSMEDHEGTCLKQAKEIDSYLDNVADAYNSNPEQKSMMLLIVMELWMSMDQSATELCRLLIEYRPGIPPDTLDVVQLPRLADMARLWRIQAYLRARNEKSKFSKTIFDDPAKGCFAERYFDVSNDSSRLQRLQQDIETAAEAERQSKILEWERLSTEFAKIQKQITESACIYKTEDGCVVHDDRGCTKCYLGRKSRRMKIEVHEHPLPSNSVQMKAVLFELASPEHLKAYRNATWRIVGVLGRSKHIRCSEPCVKLYEYTKLKAFMRSTTASGFCLASTSKPFQLTHYNGIRLPVSIEQVCLPNGLKLGYFDPSTKSWIGKQAQKPSFSHHCHINIPANSPISSLQFSQDFAANSEGPSSYEVIASQTKCPSGVNVNEYMAYQSLSSGKHRRWPSILIELGSSNLNFSTEATNLLISQLALHAGPALKDDILRVVHKNFRDERFCTKLMEQVDLRLDGILNNWREIHCMDVLLTLILRLCSLATDSCVGEAYILLEKARMATLAWIRQLRTEIHRSRNAMASHRYSKYAFWAALLCRRTFASYAFCDVGEGDMEKLGSAALECFFECSVTLQDNLMYDSGSFAKNALIRDLKMTYRMRFILRKSLEASPTSLYATINNIWPGARDSIPRSFAAFRFLEPLESWWVTFIIHDTPQTNPQTIHYHLLEGQLLVDGKPVGKLPAEYRDSVVLEQLFGKRSLLTYPSGLPGMTYTVPFKENGHQIHMGVRNNELVIQAYFRGAIMEFVPPEVFGSSSNFDMPVSLVQNCVHWLDLRTGIIEIRQQPEIWKSKPGNWRLDFCTRVAQRRRSLLVDPYSYTFQRIARIFDRFEYAGQLTVFQPEKGSLSVELRRLELSFFVNPKGRLECRELRSEIDLDQDAGTWYGLNSKLVLRDAINPRQRSILVPKGSVRYKRNRHHVAVEVENDGYYCRFAINDVLGRLECPAEPTLLYLKAHFHACTSFVVPDPLTGRTGTEEALHCLKSGYCQPWMPLGSRPLDYLFSIAKLAPRRQYYPQDMKVMQQTFWDPDLTTTIQQDEFRPVIEGILEKSRALSAFALNNYQPPEMNLVDSSSKLLHRGYSRLRLYQRPSLCSSEQRLAADLPYDAQGRLLNSQERSNVFEIVSIIRNWPSKLRTTHKLVAILQSWPLIGGYNRHFDQFLLSDLLDLQLASEWGCLVSLCRSAGPQDMYRLMFLFALISFRSDINMDIVRALLAFTLLEGLRSLEPPKWPQYMNFRYNHAPNTEYLVQLMKSCCTPYPGDERSELRHTISSKMRKKFEAAELAHWQQAENDCKVFAQLLVEQWPCEEPTIEGLPRLHLINVSQAMDVIKPEWLRLFQNTELSNHIKQVQHILDQHHTAKTIVPPNVAAPAQKALTAGPFYSSLPSLSKDLLRKTGPSMPSGLELINSDADTRPALRNTKCMAPSAFQKEVSLSGRRKPVEAKRKDMSREIQELECIINGIEDSQSTVQQRYGKDMKYSLDTLKVLESGPKEEEQSLPANVSEAIGVAKQSVDKAFNALKAALERDDSRAQWLQIGRLWPSITPASLLENLRSRSTSAFGSGMKENLVAYGVSITNLQRLLRIEDAQLKQNSQRLLEEQKNTGHGDWKPIEYTDWLLLEVDANILIRRAQVEVALATISPASRANSVLQMNMGQGKTSCVMPMVAAVLADTKNLLRVVVPQPLLLQTAQLLQARLGGLVGREVKHVPFSRKTPTNSDTIKSYFDIHQSIRESSGVIVALPEHILSFMLSGLQRLSDGRVSEATQMVRVQALLREMSRDILDESDFTLAVQTQLIYPSGSQATVDGHPHRWETAEALLQLVEGHLWNLQQDFPESIEVVQRHHSGCPLMFFLRRDAEDALIARLVGDVVRGQTSIISTGEYTQPDRLIIKEFISEAAPRPVVIERIDQMFAEKPAAKQNIYLLRGLLVHRILLLALKKRWNVQYGLHPHRDPIAVPFHAKGVPSKQAEWGHPDVAILFTCLSFYFGGLAPGQLRQSLQHVVNSDDPSSEYDRWINTTKTLPGPLREWNIINVDDEAQLTEIWQHIRYSIVVIDYFLNHFVFPKHAKQFQVKLQASAWDIPLFSPGRQSLIGHEVVGSRTMPLTTGFSGTNDTRTMLPLTIKQGDLPGLSHTNAEVLTYLLQPRNRTYEVAADACGRHLSETELLRNLGRMNIRILIDVGAQILEMDNLSLVKAWLKAFSDAPAAVYFNDENKPYLLYRRGHQVPLLASPFADNLDGCLVYLDQAHTRGTDLKMPAETRGALTLGLGQTKDQTVQAAMRLRQLGTTQSVVFLAPPEVHQSILDARNKTFGDPVDSHDVICWLLQQTISGIEQLQPLYFSHGVDFCRRIQSGLDNPDFLTEAKQRDAYLNAIRQKEQQTLEQLYKPRVRSKSTKILGSLSPDIAPLMKELTIRRKGFQDKGIAVQASALQEVEQEREVAFEVEAVREVQKPIHYSPLSFMGLHKDIARFVETGRLSAESNGYEHVFVALRRTALDSKYGINGKITTSRLFLSKEFMRTVSMPRNRPNDDFMRQVNWILWSVTTETALVIIPEEAELVIPLVLDAKTPLTHLLTYAAPVTRKMLHFNQLSYYAMPAMPIGWTPPRWLTIELGIFAGRLYFDFEEYNDLLRYLGIRDEINEDQAKAAVDALPAIELSDMDGAADKAEVTTRASQQTQSFTAKPLAFLRDWLAVRRKGQDFAHTPMGHVCQGKVLKASHQFFAKAENDGESKPGTSVEIKNYGSKESVGVDERPSDKENHTEDDNLDDEEDDEEEMFGEGGMNGEEDHVSLGVISDGPG